MPTRKLMKLYVCVMISQDFFTNSWIYFWDSASILIIFSLSDSTLEKVQPNCAIALAPFSDLFTFFYYYILPMGLMQSIGRTRAHRILCSTNTCIFWYKISLGCKVFNNDTQKSQYCFCMRFCQKFCQTFCNQILY